MACWLIEHNADNETGSGEQKEKVDIQKKIQHTQKCMVGIDGRQLQRDSPLRPADVPLRWRGFEVLPHNVLQRLTFLGVCSHPFSTWYCSFWKSVIRPLVWAVPVKSSHLLWCALVSQRALPPALMDHTNLGLVTRQHHRLISDPTSHYCLAGSSDKYNFHSLRTSGILPAGRNTSADKWHIFKLKFLCCCSIWPTYSFE